MKVVMTVTMIQTMIELKSVLYFQYHCKLDHKAKHQINFNTSVSQNARTFPSGTCNLFMPKLKLTLWQSEWSKLVGVLTIPSSEGYQGNSIWIGSFIR